MIHSVRKKSFFKKSKLVPDGYTQLEYITFNGSYIDTGVTFKSNTNFDMDLRLDSGNGNYSWILGGSFWKGLHITTVDGTSVQIDVANDSSDRVYYTATVGNKVNVKLQDSTVYYNGVNTGTFSGTQTDGTDTMCYGGYHGGGTSYNMSTHTSLFKAKFYEGSDLIRYFIPAMRNSDSISGLYDLVSGTFYAPLDSTKVTAGPVDELPSGYTRLEYIESNGTGGSGSSGQYINTGLTASNGYTVDMKVANLANTTAILFGTQANSSRNMLFTNGGYIKIGTGTSEYTGPSFSTTDTYIISANTTSNYSLTVNGTTSVSGTNSESKSSSNLLLFAGTTGTGTIAYHASCMMYYVKVTIDGSIVAYYIPAQRLSDSALGMYDTVTNTFFTNAGTGTFVAGPEADKVYNARKVEYKHKKVPDEYIQVEYLQSSGTQYIDTGVVPNNNMRTITDADWTYKATTELFGARTDSNYFELLCGGTQYIYWQYGSKTPSIDGSSVFGARLTYETNKGTLTVAGLKCESSGTISSHTNSIYLFGLNTGQGTDLRLAVAKVYSFKMWKDDTLVRNFIPAIRKSDSVLGMYDTVIGKFFTNAGTGTFTAGPYVDLPEGYEKLEYVDCEAAQYFASGLTMISGANLGYEIITSINTLTSIGTPVGSAAYFGCLPRNGSIMVYWNGTGAGSVAKSLEIDTKYTISQNYLGDLQFKVDDTNYLTLADYAMTSGAALNIGTFNGTVQPYNGKLYEVKISSGTDIVRDLVPAKDSNDDIGMYDVINGKFYTSTSGTSFIAGPFINYSTVKKSIYFIERIPQSEYKELEYIQSSGTQYIDTGIVYNPSTMPTVIVDYNLISNVDYDNKFFGALSSIGLTISGSKLRSAIKSGWGWNLVTMTTGDHSDKFIYENGVVKLYHDQVLVQTVAAEASSFTSTSKLFIGMMNGQSSLSNYMRFYSVRIGDVCNFIPAQRRSDSAIGMYDTVTKTFFTNSGTGTFIAGPEV